MKQKTYTLHPRVEPLSPHTKKVLNRYPGVANRLQKKKTTTNMKSWIPQHRPITYGMKPAGVISNFLFEELFPHTHAKLWLSTFSSFVVAVFLSWRVVKILLIPGRLVSIFIEVVRYIKNNITLFFRIKAAKYHHTI